MNLHHIKRRISRHFFNLPGWRTRKRLVVIESDDWGSIRMPSREVYLRCLNEGYPVDKNVFERLDALASGDDLELLFGLLSSVRDRQGRPAVFTANAVVANPDFGRIGSENYKKYHYELISDTFKNYPRHGNNMAIWKQGMKESVFHPQFHGREHINVSLFMNALREGDKDALFGFVNRMPGCIPKGNSKMGNRYMAATRFYDQEQKEEILSIMEEGLDLFEELFGYRSATLIPTNYIWSPQFDAAISQKEVQYYQGAKQMREPNPGGEDILHTHRLGQMNRQGQRYLIRNIHFEPSVFRRSGGDPVDLCLKDMEIAFRMRKPAIISTHRINYVGFLEEDNRDQNLKRLGRVLKTALRKWPDLEFSTSDALGREMTKGKNHS